MILVDKNIKDLSEQGFLISSGYESNHINSISYDLTLGEFLNTDKDAIDIIPGEFFMVKTMEELNIPTNITGYIGEKFIATAGA